MNERRDGWVRVGAALKARYEYLDMTQADFVRVSGVNDTTIRQLEQGRIEGNGPRAVTRHKLEDAAQWKRGSIDRILAGQEPIPIRSPPRLKSPDSSTAADVEARIAALEAAIADLQAQLSAAEQLPVTRGGATPRAPSHPPRH